MKRFNALIITLAVFLFFGGCGKRKEDTGSALKVGLVFDVGGRGDKSFNDSAYRGLKRAADELGIVYEYIEPGEGSDREAALRMLAARGFDLVFGIGFMFTNDITNISKEFPDKKFACIDYSVTTGQEIPGNLVALRFREEEGSYLVGALAGLLTKTNVVGFIGGMDIPLIHKFETGYREGVKKVNAKCEVIVGYAGVTGEAFKNPARGKELGLSQYNRGADIIYHASGSTGLGLFEAAREKGRLAIGVDSDQYHEAPGFVLTSMIKKVDEAVYEAVRRTLNDNFSSGIAEFGLKEKGIDYVYDDNNRNLIPDSVRKEVEKLRKDIIEGKIKVPKI